MQIYAKEAKKIRKSKNKNLKRMKNPHMANKQISQRDNDNLWRLKKKNVRSGRKLYKKTTYKVNGVV